MPLPHRPATFVLLCASVTALGVCILEAQLPPTSAASVPASTASLVEAGRYDNAQAMAERDFRIVEAASDPGSAGEALLEALILNGHGSETRTRALANRLIEAARSANAATGPVATRLRLLADVLLEAGDHAEAVATYRQALKTRGGVGRGETLEHARDLEHLARALTEVLATDVSAFDEAMPLVEQALAIYRESGQPHDVARALQVRGLLAQNKGENVRARNDFEQAVSLLTATRPSHPETAMALLHLGEQLGFDGALVRAEEMVATACTTIEDMLRAGHPAIANCLRSWGLVKEELGDIAAARALRARGLAIAESALGPDHPRVAVQVNDLAINYFTDGEFAGARALYEKANSIYARRLGPDSNGAIVAQFNLALVDSRLGDFRQAGRTLTRVIAVWSRVRGPEHDNVARAIAALADVQSQQGRDVDAQRSYARALAIRERIYGPNHMLVARTLSNLATTYSRLGDPRRSLELSSRALNIWEQGRAENGLAEGLVTHGQILARQGNVPAAAIAYRRALEIWTRVLGPAHPTIAENETALAGIQARLGESADSFTRGLRAQRITREHALLTLGSLPERQALEYARTWPKGLDLAISLAMTPADSEAVLNEVILGRSLTLDEMSLRRRATAEAEGQDTRALWDRLRSARQRLANLVVRGPSGDGHAYAALVDAARRDKEDAERVLAERSDTFRTNARRATIGIAGVRAALPGGTALVSFSRYDRTVVTPSAHPARGATARTIPSYMAFVLRPGDNEPVAVPLGSATAVEASITAWRDELVAGVARQPVDLVAAEKALRVPGAALRRRIWDPIATHLEGATRVFIVPDSAINLVPFAALPAVRGGYLLEHGPVVHYLSAERDLAAPEPFRIAAAPGTLLAVGGPAFSTRDVFASTARQPVPSTSPRPEAVIATRGAGVSSACVGFRTMTFNPLPAARAEAEEVAKLWTTSRSGEGELAQTLVGAVASEASFKQLAPGRRVLHLATHGFFLGDECDGVVAPGTRAVGGLTSQTAGLKTAPASRPRARRQQLAPENPLLLSGLALAGANRRASAGADEDDGILTAEEVAGLDLTGLDWAVLSACDTGLGVVRVGEGVLGLRRAFQMAGARTVIMSVWSVEDRSTRQWMRALYQGRFERNLDTADAVHQAALSTLRARRSATGSGHPFFWAGFVAAGDWR
jgi:CHAT domain-containing protein/tetratricopeptide (TPR) repeat protein